MPRDGELKIPDEPFRNRNGASESSTAANPLRTNAEILGTARTRPSAPRGVRPLGPYFFSGALVLAALGPAGTCRPEKSEALPTPTAPPALVSTATPAPRAEADLFQSTVRPVLRGHCAPCHEPGGKMYDRLPFENPQVIADHRAGVLRRLKGEDREAVEKWLATLPSPTATP
jgi:mono/diheme cytochrome c family protein